MNEKEMRVINPIQTRDKDIYCSYCGEWININENKYLLQSISDETYYEVRHKDCLPEFLK